MGSSLFKKMSTNILSNLSQPMPNIESIHSWSYKNTSLMAQTFVLGATSYGLSTSIMEGYDSRRLKQILKVPDRYGIPLMVAAGYDYEDGNKESVETPRLDIDEVFFSDTFGEH